jgi:uncharacterized protein
MKETPLWFPGASSSLFGVLHEPDAAATRVALVLCHPLVEEKLWAQRVFVSFARRLAAEGHHVLRFDYAGNGDSEGDFERSSVATASDDVGRAVQFVRDACPVERVGLIGLRFGATLASLVAEERPDLDHIVLWAPIVDGARYAQELLRVNLTMQLAAYKQVRQDRAELVAVMEQGGTVNIDGYEVAFPLYSELTAVHLADSPKQYQGPCLIVNVDRQPDRPVAELERLAACYRQCTLTSVAEEPFWKEIPQFYQRAQNLFATTVDWLQRR